MFGFKRSDPYQKMHLARDIVDMLRIDIEGPVIHIDYYRKDIAAARNEIIKLRAQIARLTFGFPEPK